MGATRVLPLADDDWVYAHSVEEFPPAAHGETELNEWVDRLHRAALTQEDVGAKALRQIVWYRRVLRRPVQ